MKVRYLNLLRFLQDNMKIGIFGVGYVGLVTGACLAELGNQVICYDIDKTKIDALNNGKIHIYEPGLKEMVERNSKIKNRLAFTNDPEETVKNSEIIFIAVGTPSNDDGSVNLNYVKGAAELIAKNMDSYKIIINKSTVPVGTGNIVAKTITQNYKGNFDVVSNPEFLREGNAIHDFMHPDRIVIGNGDGVHGAHIEAVETVKKLYAPLKSTILVTDINSAEMIKYASNAYLAAQISFINDLANFSELVSADISKVAEGMKLDKRIGKHAFLNAGIGYGGSCFPKDVRGIIDTAKANNYNLSILESVEKVNEKQKTRIVEKLAKHINISGKNICVLGLSFKPNTDDIREAPSLDVIKLLLKEKAKVRVYDPVSMDNAKKLFSDSHSDSQIEFSKDPYEAAKNSDALLILTEWNEFRELDMKKIKSLMNTALIIDGRNIFDPVELRLLGIKYESIGR